MPILNGVSVSIDALVSELRRRGHSVHIFTSRYPGHKDTDPNTHRFWAIETPWTKNYPIAFPPFYRLLLAFREHEFDIIHTHTPFTLGFVGLRWAESHELPIVSTYHTLYDRYSHYVPLPRRYVRFKIAKHTHFYYSHVNHVITPSEASLKWLRRHSVTTEATVIPTGIPSRRLLERSEIRHQLGVASDTRILLYVGRLAREKNLITLLDAARLALLRDPSLQLWLVGDGPYRRECMDHVLKLGIGDRVRFVGFVPRSEVDRYYAASDLFVFTSISETQGLVVQEAMSYGLPAITVVGGGASASISDGINGFGVRNEPKVIAGAIYEVMSDERLYSQLSEGAMRTSRESGIEAMVDQVVEVYRKVLKEHRKAEETREPYAWI